MKILHIVGEIDGGGVGSVVLNYISHIDKKNMEVHILAFENSTKKEPLLQSEFENNGCKVIYIEHRNKGYIRHFRIFKELIQKENYDIVHCHFGIWSAPYLFFTMLSGVKVRIAHSHMAMSDYSFIKQAILSFFYPLLQLSVTDRFACGRDAGRYLWGKNNDFYVMKNAIETEKFKFDIKKRDKCRRELGIKEDTIVVGHVGRFCYQKNQEFILELADRMTGSYHNLLFVLVGDGEKFDYINEAIRKRNLNDSFMLLGLRNDVNQLLQAFDVFILPSRNEGLPLAAVEAQTNGLPTVLSDKITREVALLSSTVYLDIESDMDAWIREIEKVLHKEVEINRSNCSEVIKNAGYDITEESEKLKQYYYAAVH